ncbi:MAG: hypothetical protein ACKVHP_04695, partial [Verrucomicrobiales bacterium]
MMLTFTPDHNIIATDVFELVAPHVTAHGGNWIRTAPDNRVHGTFVWTNMTPETDYDGYAKVRLFGDIDPDGEGDLDYITGAVRPTGIATGGDVLQLPDTPFSGFLGQFNIAELTRIKVDPDIPTTILIIHHFQKSLLCLTSCQVVRFCGMTHRNITFRTAPASAIGNQKARLVTECVQ